jgi:hypothetical protein
MRTLLQQSCAPLILLSSVLKECILHRSSPKMMLGLAIDDTLKYFHNNVLVHNKHSFFLSLNMEENLGTEF